ncbi:DNA cross-link repair 1a protein [Anaeramoeba ignava]|uniref:DNA cross-link repair 1a protein n=1 Tax=Anaeramoeba ignava TaxID=1746090 RepID=A0A9Q0RG48_ANAIG|nr:DNA cross-link repair 1a protein [Anaeramoeba ignava]
MIQIPKENQIQGTSFIVDGFRYKDESLNHYFLSHFHTDHTIGITKNFKKNIYCHWKTKNLLVSLKGIQPNIIFGFEYNQSIFIDNIEIQFLDANHCPGSCMFLFKFQDGKRIFAFLKNESRIDVLYLDTTFCDDSKSIFLTEIEAANYILNQILEIQKNCEKKDLKFLCLFGTYTLGKEMVVLTVAKNLGYKIYANPRKYKILMLCLDEEDKKLITQDPKQTPIHFFDMNKIRFDLMRKYLQEINQQTQTKIIGFKMTGWSLDSKKSRNSIQNIRIQQNAENMIFNIPVSSHCSLSELTQFVGVLKGIKQIIPTVNTESPKVQSQIKKMLEHKIQYDIISIIHSKIQEKQKQFKIEDSIIKKEKSKKKRSKKTQTEKRKTLETKPKKFQAKSQQNFNEKKGLLNFFPISPKKIDIVCLTQPTAPLKKPNIKGTQTTLFQFYPSIKPYFSPKRPKRKKKPKKNFIQKTIFDYFVREKNQKEIVSNQNNVKKELKQLKLTDFFEIPKKDK